MGKPIDLMYGARAKLMRKDAFLGALSMRLEMVQDDNYPTAATDGVKLFFNGDFISELTTAERIFLIAHETGHPMFLHHTRRQGRDAKLWNVAGDYQINPLLVDRGFTMPKDGLLDKAYKGLTTDTIYRQLQQQQGQGQGQNDLDPSGCGAVIDAPVGTTDERQEQERQWIEAAVQAEKIASKVGQSSSNLKEMVRGLVSPSIPWDVALREYLRPAAMDYDRKRYSRRWISSGRYEPKIRSEELEHVVIAMDTSGSVSTREYRAFLSEINSILSEQAPQHVTVIQCDSEIKSIQEFEQTELPIDVNAELVRRGGGGTRFEPVFKRINETDVLVFLTDMEPYEWPKTAPDYPVVWISTRPESRMNEWTTPNFGEVLFMDI
jgi:predicted metal-dependent peptidase